MFKSAGQPGIFQERNNSYNIFVVLSTSGVGGGHRSWTLGGNIATHEIIGEVLPYTMEFVSWKSSQLHFLNVCITVFTKWVSMMFQQQ